MCNHSSEKPRSASQWHVIGMYAPSFFIGALIARFGLGAMMASGLVLMLAAATVGLLGTAVWNFWVALALLGVGWELCLRQRHDFGHPMPRSARAQQGAGIQTIFWCSARWRSAPSLRARY